MRTATTAIFLVAADIVWIADPSDQQRYSTKLPNLGKPNTQPDRYSERKKNV